MLRDWLVSSFNHYSVSNIALLKFDKEDQCPRQC